MRAIYNAALHMNTPEPQKRFREYLERHGVAREVVNTAAEILPLISEGRKTVEVGINAYKDVLIKISSCLGIQARIAEDMCELQCRDELISCVPLRRFDRDVFLEDLVQAYQIAAGSYSTAEESKVP